MIERGRVDAVALSLPLATFSWHQRPSLRSKASPLGSPGRCLKTAQANRCALRALALLKVCLLHGIPALLFHPAASFASALPSWQSLCKSPGARVGTLPHGAVQPGWSVLSVCLPSLAEASRGWRLEAFLHPPSGLASRQRALQEAASLVDLGLSRRSTALAASTLDSKGLESPFVNNLAISASWKVTKAWVWPRPVHINILEASCVYRLLGTLAKRGGPVRFACLCDSNVARCCLTKGRSPSAGLSRVLRRSAAMCLGFGLYPALPFCPTRLMPADHPSRGATIPQPGPDLFQHLDGPLEVTAIAGLPGLRRWASNWVRLFIGVASFRPPVGLLYRFRGSSFRTFVPSPLDFDCTLGFPGEGPVSPWLLLRGVLCSVASLALLWPSRRCVDGFWPSPLLDFGCTLGFPGRGPCLPRRCLLHRSFGGFSFKVLFWAGFLSLGVGAVGQVDSSHGLLQPRNPADHQRRERRDPRGLPSGRIVEAATQRNRDALWEVFLQWLDSAGIARELFTTSEGLRDIDSVNCVLARYGRDLYSGGRPYAHYSETLNALSARAPKVRRLLQPAWDLAFSWKREEPGRHHAALPWQVLLSLVAAAFTWGWPRVAAALALAWGGLLRIGEVLQAVRADLTLPHDVRGTVDYAYLTIRDPKTRYHGARHQAVRIDQPDLLAVVSTVYKTMGGSEKLWPWSGQTLRVRFRQLCSALGFRTTSEESFQGSSFPPSVLEARHGC